MSLESAWLLAGLGLSQGLVGSSCVTPESRFFKGQQECILRTRSGSQRDFPWSWQALPKLGFCACGRGWAQRTGLIRLVLSLPVLKSGFCLFVTTVKPQLIRLKYCTVLF